MDARLRLDDLQRGAQHVPRRVDRSGNQPVRVSRLYRQHAVIHRVDSQPSGLLPGKPLRPAQLVQQVRIGLQPRALGGVDHPQARQIRPRFLRRGVDLFLLSEQDGLRQPLRGADGRGLNGAGLIPFR